MRRIADRGESDKVLIQELNLCTISLKDCKGRVLSFDDIRHYQKIVAALVETIQLMDGIDETIEEYGGWPIGE